VRERWKRRGLLGSGLKMEAFKSWLGLERKWRLACEVYDIVLLL
jgi:hypothetical protein